MSEHLVIWRLMVGLLLVWPCLGLVSPQAFAGTETNPTKALRLGQEEAFFEELRNNLDHSVFEDPGKLTTVLRTYYQQRARYQHFLFNALRRDHRERQIHTLTLIALLRLPGFVEASTALAQRNPGDDTLQEGVAFYFHRIGRRPAQNLQRLLKRLPSLVEKPSDDWVLLWMGFVDTPEPARSFLQRLGGDGAVGELVHVAREWLSLRCPERPATSVCTKDPWL